uniref:Uncharacterized protein n=1 Tax=Pseudomonas phage HRDY3 TaxID=3236930 RepID=A0AB39CE65_9VIRU
MALDATFASSKGEQEQAKKKKKKDQPKGLTDVELRLLKLPHLTKREVLIARKAACDRVAALIAVYHAAQDFRTYVCEDLVEETPITKKIAEHPLFLDPELGLEYEMIPMLLDKEHMSKYGSPKIHMLFEISDKELEQFYPSEDEETPE